jgi:hypothetical protein
MKFKRNKPVGFKVGVYGGGTGNDPKHPASNACTFATRSEAQRAGVELLSRWMQPEGFRVIETTRETPNYVFEKGADRPRSMTQEELENVAFAIARHNTKPLVCTESGPVIKTRATEHDVVEPRTSTVDFTPPTRITASQYLQATKNYDGWCPVCQEFTRDCTEPDAEGYDCPTCEQHTVVGAEQALLMGLVDF